MSQIIIPVSNSELYYEEQVQLEGREYIFQFNWFDRMNAWILNIADQDENILAAGIVVKVNFPLLNRFRDNTSLPPGLLFCVDTSGADQDPLTPFDLGSRIYMTYISSDDPDFSAVRIP